MKFYASVSQNKSIFCAYFNRSMSKVHLAGYKCLIHTLFSWAWSTIASQSPGIDMPLANINLPYLLYMWLELLVQLSKYLSYLCFIRFICICVNIDYFCTFSLRQNTYFGYIALDFYEKKKKRLSHCPRHRFKNPTIGSGCEASCALERHALLSFMSFNSLGKSGCNSYYHCYHLKTSGWGPCLRCAQSNARCRQDMCFIRKYLHAESSDTHLLQQAQMAKEATVVAAITSGINTQHCCFCCKTPLPPTS